MSYESKSARILRENMSGETVWSPDRGWHDVSSARERHMHSVGVDEDINSAVIRVTGHTATWNNDGHFAHDNHDTATHIMTGNLPNGRTVTIYTAPDGHTLIEVI